MAALGERRATVGLALDGCRWSLDALVREAERRHLRLAVSLSVTPWGVPSPREGLELAAEYDRARVGLVLDPARLSVCGAWGWGSPASGWRRCAWLRRWSSRTRRSASKPATCPVWASATTISRRATAWWWTRGRCWSVALTRPTPKWRLPLLLSVRIPLSSLVMPFLITPDSGVSMKPRLSSM